MTVQTQEQSIQKFARGTKTTLHIGFTAAAVVIAATTIYAAAQGVALSSTFLAYLANPWAIAIIVSVAAVYLLIGAYQQLCLTEGAKGQDGKGANLSVYLSKDAIIKNDTISVEESGEGENKTEKLLLNLSKADYEALMKNKQGDSAILHVLLAGKSGQVKFKPGEVNGDACKIKIADQANIANKRKELDMAEGVKSLKVAVSNQDSKALRDSVPSLQDVVVEAAISKALQR